MYMYIYIYVFIYSCIYILDIYIYIFPQSTSKVTSPYIFFVSTSGYFVSTFPTPSPHFEITRWYSSLTSVGTSSSSLKLALM